MYSLRGRGVADPLGDTAGNFARALPLACGVGRCDIGRRLRRMVHRAAGTHADAGGRGAACGSRLGGYQGRGNPGGRDLRSRRGVGNSDPRWCGARAARRREEAPRGAVFGSGFRPFTPRGRGRRAAGLTRPGHRHLPVRWDRAACGPGCGVVILRPTIARAARRGAPEAKATAGSRLCSHGWRSTITCRSLRTDQRARNLRDCSLRAGGGESTLECRGKEDAVAALRKGEIDELKRQVKGRIVLSGDPNYDEVRTIWNAMIDRRPAVIVQCATADDVSRALQWARQHQFEISIRGAGHNIAGNAVCEGGVMIDLSNMKNVRVDAGKRRAQVEPGATLADFDEAAQAHGLAAPVGINSTTGISGLTLGGGFGWLTRKYGMTVDNLASAELITANGTRIRASESENPDLFWAIRGGGGNFGVVTRFEFALHPVGPQVLAGLIVFPLDQAKQVLRQYREFVESAPEELSVWVVLRQAPPLPFLPKEAHGKEVVVLAIFYGGTIGDGEGLIAPLRRFGAAYGEHIGAQPYVQWQKAFDPLLTPGARNYWKSHNFRELRDDALNTMIEFATRLPSPQCEIFIGHIAGAANRVPADAMAYGHRDARFVLNVHGRWNEATQDATGIAWARAFFDATAPHASAGTYVNFMTEDESDRVATAYGANYARLAKVKRQYDPDNVFHLNQNIKP